MTFNLQSSEGLLQALLAATSITWSLQLQLIWRAFDTVKKTRGVGVFLLVLLVIGLAAMLLPVTALMWRSTGGGDSTYVVLFWMSLGLSALFMICLGIAYALLLVIFMRRRA
jgi:hypothetical protein